MKHLLIVFLFALNLNALNPQTIIIKATQNGNTLIVKKVYVENQLLWFHLYAFGHRELSKDILKIKF